MSTLSRAHFRCSGASGSFQLSATWKDCKGKRQSMPLMLAACDLEQMEKWTSIAVSAAEQLFKSTQAEEKKKYVLKYMASKGYDINTEDVENAIEAAVLSLHNELYGSERVKE